MQTMLDVAPRSDMPIVVRPPVNDSTPVAAATHQIAGFGIGIENITGDVDASGFCLWTYQTTAVHHFEVRIYERDQAGAPITTGPGGNDVLTTPAFKTNWAASAGIQLARFEFDFPQTLKKDKKYQIMAIGLDNTGATVNYGTISKASTSSWASGWVLHKPTSAINQWSAGTLSATGYIFRDTKDARPLMGDAKVIGTPVAAGLNLDFSTCLLEDQNGVRPLWAGSLALTAGGVVSGVTVNNHPLKSSPAGEPPVWAGHFNVTVTEVRRSDNNALLTNGVHYSWSAEGWLFGFHPLAADDYDVDVTLSYTKERIVELTYSPATLTVGKNEGADVMLVAHEDQYYPAPQVSRVPFLNVFVNGDAVTSLMPTWQAKGPRKTTGGGDYEHFAEWNRWALRKVKSRLLQGLGMGVAFYGDSITAQGASGWTGDVAAYAPNRPGVDTATGIFNGVQYSTAALQGFRSAVLAAARQETINGHVRILNNWTWLLLQYLEDAYGYTIKTGAPASPGTREIVGLNYGIGGSTSASTAGNGSNPTRLDAVTDPSPYGYATPNFAFISFGMNDHSPFTSPKHPQDAPAANYGAIIDAFRAADIVPMLVTPYQPRTTVYSQAVWREISQQIVNAAYAKECAVFPWHIFDGGDNSGFLGFPDSWRCRMNYLNHPGFRERRHYARALAQYFMP